MRHLLLTLLLCSTAISLFGQKNRLSVGYHQAYIMERRDPSILGLQLSFERKIASNWSVLAEFSMDDDCRCDVGPYRFLWRTKVPVTLMLNMFKTTPSMTRPSASRFFHPMLLFQHHIHLNSERNQTVLIGTGINYRYGGEMFFQAITWEAVVDSRWSADWAIPIRVAYRYSPPYRPWGLTAYLIYQGYFHYQQDYLGNGPMNVLHLGINLDLRLGKRPALKRE
ncbi:MAG: hypothetical protein AAF399_00600 [Bacteroidota bacterium]